MLMISNQECCYCNEIAKCYSLRSEEGNVFYVCIDCFINKIEKDFQLCPCCKKYYMAHGKEKCDVCVVLQDINPYHYKPQSIFYNMSDENTELFVGIELEINFDTIKNLANFIRCNKNEFCYFKHDGSIGCNGVEIVSHPATFVYHLKNNIWKRMFDFFDKVTDTENCGLHFHLDRKYLNDRQIKNIDYIINNFTESIKKIGGRNIIDHFWSTRTRKNINEWGINTTHCRYVAVNLTNKHTVELRCFDSTDNWEKFKYAIIAVFALAEYANYHTFEYFTKTNDKDFQVTFRKYIRRFVNKLKG
jgi:hypothetical protein